MNSSTEVTGGNARALAQEALKRATERALKGDAAVAAARKVVWDARWRAVLAGNGELAEANLAALAQLGDKGGVVALAERAKAAVTGGRR